LVVPSYWWYFTRPSTFRADFSQIRPGTILSRKPFQRSLGCGTPTRSGATLDASFNAVRRFGHVVSALGWGTHALGPLSFRAGTYSGVFTLLPLLTGEGRAHHGEILREATRLAEAGKIMPRVDPRHFTLDTVYDAYRAIKAARTDGKLIIDIAD